MDVTTVLASVAEAARDEMPACIDSSRSAAVVSAIYIHWWLDWMTSRVVGGHINVV